MLRIVLKINIFLTLVRLNILNYFSGNYSVNKFPNVMGMK